MAGAPFDCADTKSRLIRRCAVERHLLHNRTVDLVQNRTLVFKVLLAFHTTHVFLHEQDKDWNDLCFHIRTQIRGINSMFGSAVNKE